MVERCNSLNWARRVSRDFSRLRILPLCEATTRGVMMAERTAAKTIENFHCLDPALDLIFC